ncbi:LLM class flavin-dependent oxidoreductase [Mycetocola lacteus]|uniref:LLM class flavin-dependent oxidoreductase n=1 Tax=Mycetocola lacteus TaxID=76637 RepID=UPI001FE6E024|nr:LLM class flavin-dependent oxidoreductase [Mycetocola lacteus]
MSTPVQFGILSFGDLALDPSTGRRQPVADQLAETIERIRLAEEVGLGFYGLGEHHLDSYSVSSPATVLAAAASVTSTITLASAVTVLSTDDPVRVYQQFATLDQLSRGRAEIIAGRGSFTESFPLFGAELEDYDALYDEKLDLLRLIDAENPVTWSGRFRPALNGAGVFPRSYGAHLKISVGTGGNPQSSINAGLRGLPIVYAVIGGEPERFAPLVDLYRRAGETAGHTDSEVTMSGIGLIADTSQQAKETFYPYWRQTMEAGARARGWTVPSRADYDGYTHQARTILAGSPAEIADRMASVIAVTNPARYALQMDWAGVPHREVMRAIELFGTEVIPQLR